jgi:hypothetical protein
LTGKVSPWHESGLLKASVLNESLVRKRPAARRPAHRRGGVAPPRAVWLAASLFLVTLAAAHAQEDGSDRNSRAPTGLADEVQSWLRWSNAGLYYAVTKGTVRFPPGVPASAMFAFGKTAASRDRNGIRVYWGGVYARMLMAGLVSPRDSLPRAVVLPPELQGYKLDAVYGFRPLSHGEWDASGVILMVKPLERSGDGHLRVVGPCFLLPPTVGGGAEEAITRHGAAYRAGVLERRISEIERALKVFDVPWGSSRATGLVVGTVPVGGYPDASTDWGDFRRNSALAWLSGVTTTHDRGRVGYAFVKPPWQRRRSAFQGL